jgi:hypothetical protein
VNQGGEPAHDDYGLPRVDIEIPDDARELDRDVQAYHRELRALRRIERSNRWRAPLRKSGMLVPLIAGCLVMAMIGGMVLTMFSANPNFAGIAGRENPPASTGPPPANHGASARAPGRSSSPTESPGASASTTAKMLPLGTLAGAHGRISLRALAAVAIAIVPANCNCGKLIERLVAKAKPAGIKVLLVGLAGSTLVDLRSQVPQSAEGSAILAIDKHNTLWSSYRPPGLMVLLVDRHRHLRPPLAPRTDGQIDRALHSLNS